MIKFFFIVVLAIVVYADKPNLFLLKTYTDDLNVTGWYMSEKLDGVRAFWDGEKLISRGGNIFNAPAFFTDGFPEHKLDGELWSKRGDFDNISSIVRSNGLAHSKDSGCTALAVSGEGEKVLEQDGAAQRGECHVLAFLKAAHPEDLGCTALAVSGEGDEAQKEKVQLKQHIQKSRWTKLTYNIFEIPEADGNLTQRLSKVKETKYLKLIKQTKVKNKKHLISFQKQIEEKGGEGVVVRDASLPYYTGRDKNALKVKSFLDDECKVVQHLEGKGKYKNLLGSIKCKLKSGKIIKIGSGFTDKQRENPPKLGAVITFKYYGLTSKGNPRFPVFLRQRR